MFWGQKRISHKPEVCLNNGEEEEPYQTGSFPPSIFKKLKHSEILSFSPLLERNKSPAFFSLDIISYFLIVVFTSLRHIEDTQDI